MIAKLLRAIGITFALLLIWVGVTILLAAKALGAEPPESAFTCYGTVCVSGEYELTPQEQQEQQEAETDPIEEEGSTSVNSNPEASGTSNTGQQAGAGDTEPGQAGSVPAGGNGGGRPSKSTRRTHRNRRRPARACKAHRPSIPAGASTHHCTGARH